MVRDAGLHFHHFGLAVHAPESAFDYLSALGYSSSGPAVFDPLQGVNLAMRYHISMPAVEVIWPGPEASPIDALLKRKDALLYHLCYVTADAAASIAALEARGLRVLDVAPHKPAVLFGGTIVSFHHVAGVGLIELIHGHPQGAGSPLEV